MCIRVLAVSVLAAIALTAAPARADEFFMAPDELASADKLEELNQSMAVDVGLHYDFLTINNFDASVFGGYASLKAPLGNRWLLYGHLDYGNVDFDGGGDVDLWDFGGGFAWRNPSTGTFGLGVVQSNLDFGSGDFDFTSYGGFAECYHGPWTIGGHVAAYSGDGNFDGWGLGANVKGYVNPNLSLEAGIHYADIDGGPQTTVYGLGGEFKVARGIALGVRYEHAETDIGATSFDSDNWGLRANFSFGGYGAAALQDADRTGAPDFGIAFPVRHTF